MTGKKFYQKVVNLIWLIPAILIFVAPKFAEANYYIGIVGIESRAKNINLGDYTDLEQLDTNPLIYAQNIFEEILTTDLPQTGLTGVDKTLNAKTLRQNEAAFQKAQEDLRNSISLLDKGDTSAAVKLFDRKLDYLIYGYITNITITHRESVATSNLAVRVDLSVRIVDVQTGKIVCVATGKGESSSHGGSGRKSFKFGGNEISEICWHEALEKSLNQVVDRIKKQV